MFKEQCLEGRTVVVTGGGTGLGKSMALRFAELGANLVLTSRNLEHLEPAADEIRRLGVKALALPCDIRHFEQIDAVIAQAEKDFGNIDVLVNNAAGNFLCPTEDLSPNGFASVVGIVLNGSFHASLSAGRRMIASGRGGNILSIVATYAWTGSGFVVPSACAKAGVLAMTQSLGVEWAKYKIRVNAIAPGPFPTEGAWSALVPTSEADALAKEKVPLKRFGEHAELANLAAYLVSDYSGYITGECVVIDGGSWLARCGFNELATMDPDTIKPIVSAMRTRSK